MFHYAFLDERALQSCRLHFNIQKGSNSKFEGKAYLVKFAATYIGGADKWAGICAGRMGADTSGQLI